MKVERSDVSEQFDALIAGTRSRDEVEQWAWDRMQADDRGELVYEPASDEERLSRAIQFLLGVGLMCSPTSQLHTVEDFVAFRREIDA